MHLAFLALLIKVSAIAMVSPKSNAPMEALTRSSSSVNPTDSLRLPVFIIENAGSWRLIRRSESEQDLVRNFRAEYGEANVTAELGGNLQSAGPGKTPYWKQRTSTLEISFEE